ncbi:MAG: hypothetical protein ACYTGB_08415 [Planctomycetota bacterium]|jgi:uncharacterized membrane protein
MSDLRIALDSGGSWWLLAALAGIGAGLVILFYRRVAGSVDRGPLVAMVTLRALLVLLVLVMLFRPSASYQTGVRERPVLLMLADRSRSMSISDAPGLPARFDRVKSALLGFGGALDGLERDFDVRVWTFDSTARPIGRPAELSEETADGEATAVASALETAASALGGERLAGAVLLTDGADNSGTDTADRLEKLRLPVYAVGVGTRLSESEGFKDVAVTSAEAGRYAAVDNVCEVRAYVDAQGFRGRVVDVSLTVEDGEGAPEKARAELVLDGRRGDQEAVLRFTPRRAGDWNARVSVRPDPAERLTENNVQEFLLNVTEPRVKVLYVEGRVRPEYGFLRRNWALDPMVEVTSFYRVRKGLFIEQSPSGSRGGATGARFFPESFDEARNYHVFVLGDIERASFSDPQIEALRKAVSEGAGLLCLAGQASFADGGWSTSGLAELLPVQMGAGGRKEEGFSLQLTAAGRGHPVLTGCAEFFTTKSKGRLPELQFLNLLGNAKAGSELLAVHPTLKTGTGQPRPLLAVQRYGKGRSAVFAAGPTWKWELLRGRGRETPYAKFWGQLVRWLASEDVKRQSAGQGLSAHIDKRLYQPGERVRLWAEAHAEGGRLAVNAEVNAEVAAPRGGTTRLQLAPVAESPGQFETVYAPAGPGAYAMKVAARQAGSKLGEVKIQFRVGKPNLEFEKLDLDERLLRRAADATGGRYYDLAVIDELVSSLVAEQRSGSVSRELRFYPDSAPKGWLVVLVFLAAAGAEWLVRKRLQLS